MPRINASERQKLERETNFKMSVLITETPIFQSCIADGQELSELADIKPICKIVTLLQLTLPFQQRMQPQIDYGLNENI